MTNFCSPDQVATGKKYKVKLQCRECAHVYKRILKSLSDKDPPCPACKKAMTKSGGLADIIKHQKMAGPSGSNMTKAIDITAEITMQDHGLTNLKDNIRAGESAAPRLAPALQAQADNMFSGAKKRIPNTSFNPAQLGKQALSGAFRGGGPDPMNAVQPRFTRKVEIMNKTGGNA